MANKHLQTTIHAIAIRAADEIAAAVSADLHAEISRILAGAVPAHVPAAAPRRAPGRPPKHAAASTPVAKASAKPVTKAAGNATGRGPHPRRSYTDADLDKVLAALQARPGMHSPELVKQTGLAAPVLDKVLMRLREDGKVSKQGERRATTYSAV